MINLFAAAPRSAPTAGLRPGQAVHVNTRAAWLPATVTAITPTRVGVAYHTDVHAAWLAREVAPWVVLPADGVQLRPPHGLRAGDDILAFDGTTHTIAVVWPHHSFWWVIDYTSGEHTAVPPNAVLRLADPTPPVTVNGIPLRP